MEKGIEGRDKLLPFGKKKHIVQLYIGFFSALTAASAYSGVFLEKFKSSDLKFKFFEMLKRGVFPVLCLMERV